MRLENKKEKGNIKKVVDQRAKMLRRVTKGITCLINCQLNIEWQTQENSADRKSESGIRRLLSAGTFDGSNEKLQNVEVRMKEVQRGLENMVSKSESSSKKCGHGCSSPFAQEMSKVYPTDSAGGEREEKGEGTFRRDV